MNGKKAKQLRKEAIERSAIGCPNVEYERVTHMAATKGGKPVTMQLERHCTRAIYKRLKEDYIN